VDLGRRKERFIKSCIRHSNKRKVRGTQKQKEGKKREIQETLQGRNNPKSLPGRKKNVYGCKKKRRGLGLRKKKKKRRKEKNSSFLSSKRDSGEPFEPPRTPSVGCSKEGKGKKNVSK